MPLRIDQPSPSNIDVATSFSLRERTNARKRAFSEPSIGLPRLDEGGCGSGWWGPSGDWDDGGRMGRARTKGRSAPHPPRAHSRREPKLNPVREIPDPTLRPVARLRGARD